MLKLEPRNIHWLGEKEHAPWDKCAHGNVFLKINGNVIVGEAEGNDWNLSMGALHLLRTLERSHTFESPLFENLIPHCGHAMFKIDEEPGFGIIECFTGINFQVIHAGENITIVKDGHPHTVTRESWHRAVVGFSEAVRAFHSSNDPKIVEDELEREGFEKFMEEWDSRHTSAVRLGNKSWGQALPSDLN